MKDEIKEILDRLKIKSDRYNHHLKYNMSYENKDEDYEAHLLLDYITNLQQIEQEHQRINGELREENKRLKKQINDAIKCINYYSTENEDYSKIYNLEEKELLNILKGDDKE